MPSDARAVAALAALAPVRDRYRSALATTLEEVRVWLDHHRAEAMDRGSVLAAELGPVAARHVDAGRLAVMIGGEVSSEPVVHQVVAAAFQVLSDLAARGDDAFVVDLVPGEHLYQAVSARLADLGRAMGAARVVDLARSGRYRPSAHDPWLVAFPFGLWSQAERELAPPLVMELDGADLRAVALSEFLDGGVKLVLVARSESGPAPLVRLVTPQTFVAQDTDGAAVLRMVAWSGPGIAALLTDGAARFVHDPSRGGGLSGRLDVAHIPAVDPKRRAGPFTAAQQREDLEQLKALKSAASASSAESPAPGPAPADDPASKLAAWLLQQADLAGT
jgi:hypothetical protein